MYESIKLPACERKKYKNIFAFSLGTKLDCLLQFTSPLYPQLQPRRFVYHYGCPTTPWMVKWHVLCICSSNTSSPIMVSAGEETLKMLWPNIALVSSLFPCFQIVYVVQAGSIGVQLLWHSLGVVPTVKVSWLLSLIRPQFMVYTAGVTISQFTPVYMSTVATIATKKERLLAWLENHTKFNQDIRLLVTDVGLADQNLCVTLISSVLYNFPPSPLNAPIHWS